MKVVVPLVGLLMVLSSQALSAGPCDADIKKFCSNVQPGEGRIVACLRQNRAQISQECFNEGARQQRQSQGNGR